MVDFKRDNHTNRSTDDRTAPAAELEGEAAELEGPLPINGCPDPINCTPPDASADSSLRNRAAA
jgi:hypothetical protein